MTFKLSSDLLKQAQDYSASSTMKSVVVRFTSTTVDPYKVAKSLGGTVRKRLSLVRGAALRVPYSSLLKLGGLSTVVWSSPDRQIRLNSDPYSDATGASQLWGGAPDSGGIGRPAAGLNSTTAGSSGPETGSSFLIRGAGVGIAVIDTGVNAADPDLQSADGGNSRVVHFRDYVGGLTTAYDDNGHGTHVAGIIAGNGVQSNGQSSGMAPDAPLISIKVLDRTGRGNVGDVIDALAWCVENRDTYAIRIVNLSLGHDAMESYQTDPLCNAVRQCVANGIAVVCSAGNKGKDPQGNTRYGGISTPAIEPSAITVGALNTRGTVARSDDLVCTFSSRGPTNVDQQLKPDLLAPGNRIASLRVVGSYLDTTFPQYRVTADNGASYFSLSGTSMGAPQVAGALALLIQMNPNLPPNALKAALMYSAERLNLQNASGAPLTAGISALTQGAGSLNVAAAAGVVGALDGTAAVGSVWLFDLPPAVTYIGGEAVETAQHIYHSGNRYTGQSAIDTRYALYGAGALWSASPGWGSGVPCTTDGVTADTVLWGDSVLWGDTVLWGDLNQTPDP